jgi:PKD repeat protein
MTWQQVKVSPINAGGAAVKWYFGDGTTSNNSTVTHRYQNTGKYQIKLVLTSPITGCKDSTIVEVQIDPSSIEKTQITKGVTVYPNPGKQYFFIQSINERIEGLNLRIMNMTGQVVLEQTMSAEQVNKGVQTQMLPAGIYMISLEGHQSFMWIKE